MEAWLRGDQDPTLDLDDAYERALEHPLAQLALAARSQDQSYSARLRMIAASRLPESARQWGGKSAADWCREVARICRVQKDESAARLAEAAILRVESGTAIAVQTTPAVLIVSPAIKSLTVVDAAKPWNAVFFPWSAASDPLKNLEAWRKLAKDSSADSSDFSTLDLDYNDKGPEDIVPGLKKGGKIGADHFGMIASAKLSLSKGRWKFIVDGDDGVRVLINGKVVMEEWSYPRRARTTATWEQPADGEVDVRVEHFENSGWAQLRLKIERE